MRSLSCPFTKREMISAFHLLSFPCFNSIHSVVFRKSLCLFHSLALVMHLTQLWVWCVLFSNEWPLFFKICGLYLSEAYMRSYGFDVEWYSESLFREMKSPLWPQWHLFSSTSKTLFSIFSLSHTQIQLTLVMSLTQLLHRDTQSAGKNDNQ